MNDMASFDDIADNLGFLDDWEDRYRYLIELGQALPPLDALQKTQANKVNGCISQVWLVVDEENADGQQLLKFSGDSDAMIVKGLVAILVALYSGKSAGDIAAIDAIAELDALGLREHLTTQRSNGLVAMVERIKAEARARTA